MPVAEKVMVKDVKTFKPGDKLSKVAKTFAEHGISGAPVVDDENKVIGIITEHDIIKLGEKYPNLLTPIESHLPLVIGLSIKDYDPEGVAKALNDIKEKKVGDVMSRNVVTASPSAGLGEIARMMQKHKINRIPVVDEKGKLLGLITRADLIKGFWKT
jgi:CBS domain-containing protein